jgi:arylsulfatase A-like enzyme
MAKPNIVLIIAEELRADFLGYDGNTEAETPFLDKLSSESVTFTRHFTVHSKCVPSRCALFSGRYPHVDGHRTLGIRLQKEEINLARILKDDGYYNVLALKNHIVAEDILFDCFHEHWTFSHDADVFAFHNVCTTATSHPTNAGNKYADNYIFGKTAMPETQWQDFVATQRAVDFIRRSDKPSPFFLNINYGYVHPPYCVMDPYYSTFMSKELKPLPEVPGRDKPDFMYRLHALHNQDPLDVRDRKEMKALYYGMLRYLDARVREIYDALNESGQLDNTILVFTSDHGDFVGQYGIPEKWDTIFSDCLIRIPLLIRYPAAFGPRQIDPLNENVDFLPTILDILGIEKPYGIQGKSLLPLIRGECEGHKRYVFAEGGHEQGLLKIQISPEEQAPSVAGYRKKASLRNIMPDSLRKAKMVRTEKHKLVHRIKDKCELYDLEADPMEMVNVYNDPDYAKIKAVLERILLNHLIETEQNLPFDPRPIA